MKKNYELLDAVVKKIETDPARPKTRQRPMSLIATSGPKSWAS
jgi:hypothetical protein